MKFKLIKGKWMKRCNLCGKYIPRALKICPRCDGKAG